MPPENNPPIDPTQGKQQDSDIHLKQIRTFQGDVAEALGRQEESLVSIQRHEQARQDPRNSPEAITRRKKQQQFVLFFLGSIVLFAIAGGGAWYTYQEFVRKSATPIIAGPDNRFFSTNNSQELLVATSTRTNFLTLLQGATGGVPAGTLSHIVVKRRTTVDELVSTEWFFKTLAIRAPGSLVRAFDPLFMFGAVGTESTTTPSSVFLIIKLSSFENAYAGMLDWENGIVQDLGPLFKTSEKLMGVSSEATFLDLTDKNKDMRVLVTTEGEVLLIYSFFENEYLIITDDLTTMRTLIDRLTREKLSR